MKKFTTLVLALALCAGLCIPASAAKTVASTQNLSVDGAIVDCEKYNIDGSNYFKLRDLAALLNGSQAQFSVGYDAEKNLVTITTGGCYEYNGSELVTGTDKSATSKESRQTIQIDGEEVSGVSVYNIGGNNYFKLRDLADALGFEVGYDEATRTATVDSVPFHSETACTYDANGKCLTELTTAEDYTVAASYTYNENGLLATCESTVLYGGEEVTAVDTYTYDEVGNLIKLESVGGDGDVTSTFTYDDQGRATSASTTSYEGTYTSAITYAEDGTRTEVYELNGVTTTTVTAYDDAGREISVKCSDTDGISYEIAYTYNEKGDIASSTITADGDPLVTNYTYTYDAAGRVLVVEEVMEGTDSTDTTVNVYNAHGDLVLSRHFIAMG